MNKLPREQRVPGALRHHANRKRILGVRSGETILHKQLAALERLHQPRINLVENLRRHRLVD